MSVFLITNKLTTVHHVGLFQQLCWFLFCCCFVVMSERKVAAQHVLCANDTEQAFHFRL